jgi:2-dehydro-3-deoxyglucarate aldolase
MNQNFRKRLRAGDLLIGTMVTLGSPETAEVLAGVGFDWLFLDAEHSPMETPDLQRVMQGAGPVPCVVRLPASAEVPVKKALDIGAAGIIAPMVNSAERAAQVVRFARYSPLGTRGVGLGRAHGYGLKFREYLDSANENVAVIVQAEHIDAVKNIGEILRVPGIDGVLVGPYDLSGSLGRPGEVVHPEVREAIDRVTEACRNARIPLGIFGLSAEAVMPYITKGYTLIVAGVDTVMLGSAAKDLLAKVRG